MNETEWYVGVEEVLYILTIKRNLCHKRNFIMNNLGTY